MSKRAIIVHGWSGSPDRDFMPWLKEELHKRDYEVLVPAMPDTDNPKIDTWVPYLKQVVGVVSEEDILIGHSMGCQTILRFLETLNENEKVNKVVLVAGFGPVLTGLTAEEELIAQPWLDAPLNFDKIKTKAKLFLAIFSDDDPFVPLEENKKLFEEQLEAKTIVEHDKGHFNKMPKERPNSLIGLFDE